VACAYRKLDPTILMMKSAEDRLRNKLTVQLNRPIGRRILVQRQMCSAFVVIAGVGRKDPAQMGFTEDDDVIEAFTADRADQSLRMTVRRVAVSDAVVRRFVLGEGIGDLAGDPLRCWVGRHAERYQPPALVPEDEQDVQQRKPTVGTTGKSVAPMPAAWLCRKVFQVCDRPRPLFAMYLATVD